MSPLVFFLLAVPAVAAALTVITHRNPVHCACALVVTLFLLSVFFVGLDAQLVGVLQVIVYAGAIVVLFLFVIMLLNLTEAEARPTGSVPLVAAALAASVAVTGLVFSALGRSTPPGVPDVPDTFGTTAALGRQLFTVYLLPFELTSVLLLVAIVGAVVLAKKRI